MPREAHSSLRLHENCANRDRCIERNLSLCVNHERWLPREVPTVHECENCRLLDDCSTGSFTFCDHPATHNSWQPIGITCANCCLTGTVGCPTCTSFRGARAYDQWQPQLREDDEPYSTTSQESPGRGFINNTSDGAPAQFDSAPWDHTPRSVPDGMRFCTSCRRIRPLSAFYHDDRPVCAECRRARKAAYRATQGLTLADDITFGVEIEGFLPPGVKRSAISRRLSRAGLPARREQYNHIRRPYWKVVTDASLNDSHLVSDGWVPFELNSPPLCGAEGLKALKRACAILGRLGVRVDDACGLHVHWDAHSLDVGGWKRLVKLYASYEGALDSIMPRERTGNRCYYAKSLVGWEDEWSADYETVDLPKLFEKLNQRPSVDTLCEMLPSRFFKLNLEAWVDHGTVEFRHHDSTIEYERIVSWLIVTRSLLDVAKQPGMDIHVAQPRHSFEHLASLVRLPRRVENFYERRQYRVAAAAQAS